MMKPPRLTARICLALASLLFLLGGALFLTGCDTGDGGNSTDHSQHHH